MEKRDVKRTPISVIIALVEYSQLSQGAIPHHRNPHQIHEATKAPTTQTI
jgi:hypothetical protein